MELESILMLVAAVISRFHVLDVVAAAWVKLLPEVSDILFADTAPCVISVLFVKPNDPTTAIASVVVTVLFRIEMESYPPGESE